MRERLQIVNEEIKTYKKEIQSLVFKKTRNRKLIFIINEMKPSFRVIIHGNAFVKITLRTNRIRRSRNR